MCWWSSHDNSNSLIFKERSITTVTWKKSLNCAFGNSLLAILLHAKGKIFLSKTLGLKKVLNLLKLHVWEYLTYYQPCELIFSNEKYNDIIPTLLILCAIFYISLWEVRLVFFSRYVGESSSNFDVVTKCLPEDSGYLYRRLFSLKETMDYRVLQASCVVNIAYLHIQPY